MCILDMDGSALLQLKLHCLYRQADLLRSTAPCHHQVVTCFYFNLSVDASPALSRHWLHQGRSVQGSPSRTIAGFSSRTCHHIGSSSPTPAETSCLEYAPCCQHWVAHTPSMVIISDNLINKFHHVVDAATAHGPCQHQQIILLSH
jgi:hypothetical protein